MSNLLNKLARFNDKTAMKAITDEADGGRAILFGALDAGEPKHRQAVLNNFAHITDDALRAEVMQRAEQIFLDVGAPEEDRLAALSGLQKSTHAMLSLYEVGLQDANHKVRFNTLYNIKLDKTWAKKRPITPEIFDRILAILRDDPEVVVHDYAVLTLASIEPTRFIELTATRPVNVVATYRRLSAIPNIAPMMTELNPYMQTPKDAASILDWFESGEVPDSVELTLEAMLRSVLLRNKDAHPELVERHEKYLIGKWLKDMKFPTGSTWETAVQAVASGEVDFRDVASWFSTRGMETQIEQLYEASLNAASTPEMKAKVQASYDLLIMEIKRLQDR